MTLEVDPVCGMKVDPKSAAGTYEYKNKTYYFCNTHCLDKFSEGPEHYLNKPTELMPVQPVGIQRAKSDKRKNIAAAATSDKTEYTCPMHPEIVRDSPGSCPICGMALEPRTASLVEEENSELREMSLRLWV